MTASVSLARAVLLGAVTCALAALSACATNRTVAGKVLAGQAGVASVVQANDPRLEEQGLAGVEVRVTDGSQGMGSLATATSGADGSFSLKVPEEAMTSRLEIHATSDEILPFHGSAVLPMDDRKLLLFVEPHGSMRGGE